MQPIHRHSNSSKWSETPIEEPSPHQFLTEEQIDNLPTEELRARFKNSQVVILKQSHQVKTSEDEFKKMQLEYQKAISDATNAQAVANLQENRRNRTDYQALHQNTSLSLTGKVLSVVLTVVSLIVTIICIFV